MLSFVAALVLGLLVVGLLLPDAPRPANGVKARRTVGDILAERDRHTQHSTGAPVTRNGGGGK